MQGDNVIFTTVSVQAVEALVAMYQTLGYKVHPHKTYISRDRGEFLRRSYEHGGITGYTPRTLLALRNSFRNPIFPIPIAPAERLYSRLALRSLARQRGACPDSCAQMYLEDAAQAGIEERTASAFALTSATFGGAGLEVEHGYMGKYLMIKFGREQPWLRPRIKKTPLEVRPTLGRWKQRLKNLDIDFTGGYRQQFSQLLAIKWGLREADITGNPIFLVLSLLLSSGPLQ
ncbi:unnamed protein product [Arctia plantaginis]|uniref:Uncharacterized protein n=1 Tax=Arctia plantaginis TaxID=874455 RepID=A0A8S1B4B8_ARCPL|nr:unnamed protein product [Arctia plantaginis]